MQTLKNKTAALAFTTFLATVLTGCSTVRNEVSPNNDGSPQARQCAKALGMAEEQIELARGMKGRGALSLMRASHTHSSAKRAQGRGNYQECTEKAMKSQNMVREAYRANTAQEN